MRRQPFARKPNPRKATPAPSRFAASTFRSASLELAQKLCDDLAKRAARGFVDLAAPKGKATGPAIVQELRANGHDLICIEDTDELQQWQATLYHPKGTFMLLLTYRAPRHVDVIFRVDDVEVKAHA